MVNRRPHVRFTTPSVRKGRGKLSTAGCKRAGPRRTTRGLRLSLRTIVATAGLVLAVAYAWAGYGGRIDPTGMSLGGEQSWVETWKSGKLDVAILTLSLVLLLSIFFCQNWFVRRRTQLTWLRTGFLLFSIGWLGLYAKAQLSAMHVFTFTHVLTTGFSWVFFLEEPLIFILWSATVVLVLLWGRGAYCGWLCPFGAAQELLNRAARRIGIRQISPPYGWHERLSGLKYVLFLGILGVSLGNMVLAEQLLEVEPFKTVVLLRFVREWPFVLFAAVLLGASLFIGRFYCRYLCVLGAALAIPTRSRMFDWQRRRKQCGRECQLCAESCTVEAIDPLGAINANECINCLRCQLNYWDDHVCPPLIRRREQKQGRLFQPPLSQWQKGGNQPMLRGPSDVD